MDIGILGAGGVGGRLGRLWAAQGHAVRFGVRDPNSPKTQAALQAAGSQVRAGSFAQAARAEIVVLAVSWAGAAEALQAAGDLRGKILIDCTNRLGLAGPGEAASAGETVAGWASGARVVKAFNSIGAEHLDNPRLEGQAVTMFICGDEAEAKATVAGLVESLGFDVADAGPLSAAGLLEGLAKLWIHLARTGSNRDIGFRLLRR